MNMSNVKIISIFSYTILTVMKPTVPPANIIIATLYLLIIIAIGYVTKLAFKANNPGCNKTKGRKYSK